MSRMVMAFAAGSYLGAIPVCGFYGDGHLASVCATNAMAFYVLSTRGLE